MVLFGGAEYKAYQKDGLDVVDIERYQRTFAALSSLYQDYNLSGYCHFYTQNNTSIFGEMVVKGDSFKFMEDGRCKYSFTRTSDMPRPTTPLAESPATIAKILLMFHQYSSSTWMITDRQSIVLSYNNDVCSIYGKLSAETQQMLRTHMTTNQTLVEIARNVFEFRVTKINQTNEAADTPWQLLV